MIDNISNIVRDLVGSKYLYLDSPISIKLSKNSFPLNITAVCTTPAPYNIVYVMDGGNQWHELNENSDVKPLYTRIKTIQKLTA